MTHARTWLVPPVMVAGYILGTPVGYKLLVGYTRLGNLLGLLDRQEVTETGKHLVGGPSNDDTLKRPTTSRGNSK